MGEYIDQWRHLPDHPIRIFTSAAPGEPTRYGYICFGCRCLALCTTEDDARNEALLHEMESELGDGSAHSGDEVPERAAGTADE